MAFPPAPRMCRRGRDVELSDKGGAVFSAGRRLRHLLWRGVDVGGTGRAVFVMLNPSIAGAFDDDPTIRRVVGFARALGVVAVDVVNLYPWIATDPKDMARALRSRSYVPAEDDVCDVLEVCAGEDVRFVVAAWGASDPGTRSLTMATTLRERPAPLVRPLVHLGLTKKGHPRHPLFLPASTTTTTWAA